MKKLALLLPLLLFMGCRKVSEIPDYAFKIGTYDSHDEYVLYDEPLKMGVGFDNSIRNWDFDKDGEIDFQLVSFKIERSDSSFTGLRAECPEAGGWEFPSLPFYDSTFHCLDTNTLWGNTYYSKTKGYTCVLDLDTFVRVDTLCDVAKLALYGNTWSDMKNWTDFAYMHYYKKKLDSTTFYDFETTHYKNWAITEFFIPFEKTESPEVQRAWIHMSVILEDYKPVEFQIIDYAVQMIGAI